MNLQLTLYVGFSIIVFWIIFQGLDFIVEVNYLWISNFSECFISYFTIGWFHLVFHKYSIGKMYYVSFIAITSLFCCKTFVLMMFIIIISTYEACLKMSNNKNNNKESQKWWTILWKNTEVKEHLLMSTTSKNIGTKPSSNYQLSPICREMFVTNAG